MSCLFIGSPGGYQCTPKALEILNRRDNRIPMRWRQFLLLLRNQGAHSHLLRQTLLDAEQINSLLHSGLIEQAGGRDPVETGTPPPRGAGVRQQSAAAGGPAPTVSDPLAFEATRQLMQERLQQSCGLLAAGLSGEIARAAHTQSLLHCLPRWKMTLLDSRVDRGQLLVWIEEVTQAVLQLTDPART